MCCIPSSSVQDDIGIPSDQDMGKIVENQETVLDGIIKVETKKTSDGVIEVETEVVNDGKDVQNGPTPLTLDE